MWRVLPILLFAAVSCKKTDDARPGEPSLKHWVSAGSHVAPDLAGLPPGEVTFTSQSPGDTELAYVNGKGFFRSTGAGWSSASDGMASPTLAILNPDVRPVPLQMAWTDEDSGFLACAGGLFQTENGGASWEPVNTGSAGSLGVLFTGVAVRTDTVVAVAMVPEAMIPAQFAGILSGTVFVSEDGGSTFTDQSVDSMYASAAAIGPDGTMYVGTLDDGIFANDGSGWRNIGGPSDTIALSWTDSLGAGAAAGGLWHLNSDESWSWTDSAPVVSIDDGVAVTWDGSEYTLATGEGSSFKKAGGTVYISLSFHINWYHSYRGDSPTNDGFGLDIDVMTRVLEWLEEYPQVRADWDTDNAFSSDDWMPEYGPEILAKLHDRVESTHDDMRLMSWNNGAMASSTRSEFNEAIDRAKTSNEAVFGRWVPGVQPQENMLSPDHLAWYPEEGVEWITLFNAANGFTAIREDVELEGSANYNPVTLTAGAGEMTMVPVYHHGDLLEHGGLLGWARQISDRYAEDTLLVIHLDADAASWEQFDRELAAVADYENIEWITINNYLQDHSPVASAVLPGDVADGTGDGFQSWAEKDFNHRQFTEVVRSREDAALAEILAYGHPGVFAMLEEAQTARLLALSTTNYGLAAPFLHPDRVASAEAQAAEARQLSLAALDLIEAGHEVLPGTLQVVNARSSAGPALVSATLDIPPGTWAGPEGFSVFDGATELVATATLSGPDQIDVQFVVQVYPSSARVLTWAYDPASPAISGSLTAEDAPTIAELGTPFTDCEGVRSEGSQSAVSEDIGINAASATTTQSWDLPACDGAGTLTRELTNWQGFPGTIVHIEAEIGTATEREDLESVVLTPLECDRAETLTWRTFGGEVWTRPARHPVETWNGQSVDGWLQMACADGTHISVSHRVLERTSIAFAPLQNEGTTAILAPLGALWGDGPHHDARRTGGHGMGDLILPVVGSQFSPPAPDWSGANASYTLLVGEDLDPELMDLFAHPPWVRAPSN